MRSILLLLLFLIITAESKAQLFSGRFGPGYYYTIDGQKVVGKIDRNADLYWEDPKNRYLLFKPDFQERQVDYKGIRSFVVDKDSFTVSHTEFLAYRVLLNTPVKLYSYFKWPPFAYGRVYPVKETTYLYGSSPDDVTFVTRENFIEVMSMIMADKPNVVAKIKDKTYRLAWIDDLITYYQTGQMPGKDNDKYNRNKKTQPF